MRSLLFLLIFFSGTLQAQTKVADSLLVELKLAREDAARVVLYNKLGKQLLLTDARESEKYAQAALDLAAVTGQKKEKAVALSQLSCAHLVMGEYGEAMDFSYQALQLSDKLHDTTTLIMANIGLGNVYLKLKDHVRALHFYNAASQLATRTQNRASKAKIYNNVGNIYEDQGNYTKALSYFRKAAQIQEELHDKKSWAVSLHNIGNVHRLLGKPEEGLTYLFQSVRLNEEIQNNMIKMASLTKIAEAYLALQQHQQALIYAKQSLAMALKVNSSKKIAEAALTLQAVHASLKAYDQAYTYLLLYKEHSEIINAENRARLETELTAKYESVQKERENQHLKEESERQAHEIHLHKITLVLGAIIILLMLVLLIVLYISRQKGKVAYFKLQEAHHQMQAQQHEIIAQKNEISQQTVILKEQNEQLARHHSFKNKVFSIITHDMRGPFNSTKGVLDMARRTSLSESEVKHLFGLLGKNIDTVMNMLDNVLVWARAQFKETQVSPELVNLHQLGEENIRLAQTLAEKKNIRLLNHIVPGFTGFADKERLSFVVRNLLMNAVKFTYPGGEVKLEVLEQEHETWLVVQDNGRGIPAANLQKLFMEGRFTTPGTSGEKGTGLGLKLCKELAESFKGTLQVSSEEGKGSMFAVILPKVKESEEALLADAEAV